MHVILTLALSGTLSASTISLIIGFLYQYTATKRDTERRKFIAAYWYGSGIAFALGACACIILYMLKG